jgi:hypothetical protein
VIIISRQMSNSSTISWREKATFDDIHCNAPILHLAGFFYSASSLNQYTGKCRQLAPLRKIILILSQQVFALTP